MAMIGNTKPPTRFRLLHPLAHMMSPSDSVPTTDCIGRMPIDASDGDIAGVQEAPMEGQTTATIQQMQGN